MLDHGNEMELRLLGYRTATAEVLYHLPEHPHVLQTFVWQTLDLAPRFPRIHRFLDYWVRNIDGVLHSVRLASACLAAPRELTFVDGEFRVH
ncbi:MAG: Usg family protein [Pseudomonadota bacterium]